MKPARDFSVNQCPSAVFRTFLLRTRCVKRHSVRVINTQAALWSWNMPCSFHTSAMRKKYLKRQPDRGCPAPSGSVMANTRGSLRSPGGTGEPAAVYGPAPIHAHPGPTAIELSTTAGRHRSSPSPREARTGRGLGRGSDFGQRPSSPQPSPPVVGGEGDFRSSRQGLHSRAVVSSPG